jgi:hypothetical protein
MTTKDQEPFADVRIEGDLFSIPELKWRELLFVGALRSDGDEFVRDLLRPLPPFAVSGLFPPGARFRASRVGGRILVERLYSPARSG